MRMMHRTFSAHNEQFRPVSKVSRGLKRPNAPDAIRQLTPHEFLDF